MSIMSFTLPGAKDGIYQYLTGDPNEPWEPFSGFSIWVAAQAQSFFSIGYSSGLFPTYASYRLKNKPLLKQAAIIVVVDYLLGFLFGFVIFSLRGYLVHEGVPHAEVTSGTSLVFIALPKALDMISGTRFWVIIFFIALFLLGFDIMLMFVEAVTSWVYDDYYAMKPAD